MRTRNFFKKKNESHPFAEIQDMLKERVGLYRQAAKSVEKL